MSEIINEKNNFEQSSHREIEQKFLPLFPEKLDEFRTIGIPIEQVYLSHPSEDFNLRIRQTLKNDKPAYKATLKDSGTVTEAGLDRMEVEAAVAAETYGLYNSLDYPYVKKLRAEPAPDVVIDFFEDGHIHAESENPASWQQFISENGLDNDFVEVTGDRITDNEWRAHMQYRRNHNGHEALVPASELDTDQIRLDILRHQITSPLTVVRITGRSGSGKSTVVRELQAKLGEVNLPSIVLSTDDYHRGKTWLDQYSGGEPWTQWDAAIVYDRESLVADIEALRRGEAVRGRRIDFKTQEPVIENTVVPAPVILLEGIYAQHADFANVDLNYEVATPLATCIGRRILRDIIERPQFATPSDSLRYILEQAEPAYRTITEK